MSYSFLFLGDIKTVISFVTDNLRRKIKRDAYADLSIRGDILQILNHDSTARILNVQHIEHRGTNFPQRDIDSTDAPEISFKKRATKIKVDVYETTTRAHRNLICIPFRGRCGTAVHTCAHLEPRWRDPSPRTAGKTSGTEKPRNST